MTAGPAAPGSVAILSFLWEGKGLSQTVLGRGIPIGEAMVVCTLDRVVRDGVRQGAIPATAGRCGSF